MAGKTRRIQLKSPARMRDELSEILHDTLIIMPHSSITINKALGDRFKSANLHEVQVATRERNNTYVLKSYSKEQDTTLTDLFKKDKASLELKHPNLVLPVYVTVNPPGILEEYMSYRFSSGTIIHTLDECLASSEAGKFFQKTGSVTLKISKDICSALRFLHERNLPVGNLRSNAVYITRGQKEGLITCKLKIPFFSDRYLKQIYTGSATRSLIQEIKHVPYQSPEQLQSYIRLSSQEIDDKKADIWALGMIIYRLLHPNFNFPYEGGFRECKEKDLRRFLITRLESEGPPSLPVTHNNDDTRSLTTLYHLCTQVTPGDRPRVKTLTPGFEEDGFATLSYPMLPCQWRAYDRTDVNQRITRMMKLTGPGVRLRADRRDDVLYIDSITGQEGRNVIDKLGAELGVREYIFPDVCSEILSSDAFQVHIETLGNLEADFADKIITIAAPAEHRDKLLNDTVQFVKSNTTLTREVTIPDIVNPYFRQFSPRLQEKLRLDGAIQMKFDDGTGVLKITGRLDAVEMSDAAIRRHLENLVTRKQALPHPIYVTFFSQAHGLKLLKDRQTIHCASITIDSFACSVYIVADVPCVLEAVSQDFLHMCRDLWTSESIGLSQQCLDELKDDLQQMEEDYLVEITHRPGVIQIDGIKDHVSAVMVKVCEMSMKVLELEHSTEDRTKLELIRKQVCWSWKRGDEIIPVSLQINAKIEEAFINNKNSVDVDDIVGTPGTVDLLHMTAGSNIRVLREHLGTVKQPVSVPTCNYHKFCADYFRHLAIPDAYLDPAFDVCICCHCYNGDRYISSGEPPALFSQPTGWVRFGFQLPPQAEEMQVLSKWHVAYHGTRAPSLLSILRSKDLLMPDDVTIDGVHLSPPEGHFTDTNKPRGFDIRQVFVTPSILYAALPAYAKLDSWRKRQVQVVLEMRIKPGAYQIKPETVGLRKRNIQLEEKIPNEDLEWSTKNRGATMIVALLVKLK